MLSVIMQSAMPDKVIHLFIAKFVLVQKSSVLSMEIFLA